LRGFFARTKAALSWSLVLRGLLAFFVAPLLPAVVFALCIIVPNAAFGVRVEDTFLFFSVTIVLWSIPATWVCLPVFLWIYERRGVRSLSAYVATGFTASFLCSVIFPPAMLLAVPAGSLIAFGVWCALWLGRRPRRASGNHAWRLRSRVKAD
jgi:hypothetical protein